MLVPLVFASAIGLSTSRPDGRVKLLLPFELESTSDRVEFARWDDGGMVGPTGGPMGVSTSTDGSCILAMAHCTCYDRREL